MRCVIILALLLFLGCRPATPPDACDQFTGTVVGITDGDTIKVLINRQTVTVRLEGIDAPESHQSFGRRAKQALADLVAERTVTIRKIGTDQYDRTPGVVIVNGVNVNAALVEQGWAWHYTKYNSDQRLAELEVTARAAKRGLWEDPNPLAPWEFRARQRSQQSASGDAGSQRQYWLNTSSGVRHNPGCEYFKNTTKGRLCGPDEGKPCGICGG